MICAVGLSRGNLTKVEPTGGTEQRWRLAFMDFSAPLEFVRPEAANLCCDDYVCRDSPTRAESVLAQCLPQARSSPIFMRPNGGQMKLRFVAFLVLLFSTGETLAPSKTSKDIITSQVSSLDPTKRISQYVHTAWRIQDGVLPGLPEAITQTTDGYLWIGTYAGLGSNGSWWKALPTRKVHIFPT